MTMRNVKTKAIIAFVALIVTASVPSAFATPGQVESYYWQTDPELCFNDDQLDDITLDGSQGEHSAIRGEVNQAVGRYQAAMDDQDIRYADNNCTSRYIIVGSDAMGSWGYTATTSSYYSGSQFSKAIIEFNTDKTFGDDTNTCTSSIKDIEWVAMHEIGHAVGLKHHWHMFYSHSVMDPFCNTTWATISSVDDTALNIHY